MENGKYTESELAALRKVPIIDVLASFGKSITHTASGHFYSPFRVEKSPSFHVNSSENVFFDFGDESNKGDVFTLTSMLLRQNGRPCGYKDACNYLAQLDPSIRYRYEENVITVDGKRSDSNSRSHFTITSIDDKITSSLMLDYGTKKRCIPQDILNHYCSQINYTIHYDGEDPSAKKRQFSSIGFPNKSGQWAIRNHLPKGKGGQRSTGQDITVIDRYGYYRTDKQNNVTPSCGTVVVFEGFMNFLSWLAWTNRGVSPVDTDVVVLNSAGNTARSLDYLSQHSKVVCYLDNDETGVKHTQEIIRHCKSVSTSSHPIQAYDGAGAYSAYNDINDAWKDVYKNRCESLSPSKVKPLPSKVRPKQRTP